MLIFFLDCADDGDPGSKGDKSDAGEQGVAGEEGHKGDPETANVIYSERFFLNLSSDKYASHVDATSNRLVSDFEAPEITKDIVDKGL